MSTTFAVRITWEDGRIVEFSKSTKWNSNSLRAWLVRKYAGCQYIYINEQPATNEVCLRMVDEYVTLVEAWQAEAMSDTPTKENQFLHLDIQALEDQFQTIFGVHLDYQISKFLQDAMTECDVIFFETNPTPISYLFAFWKNELFPYYLRVENSRQEAVFEARYAVVAMFQAQAAEAAPKTVTCQRCGDCLPIAYCLEDNGLCPECHFIVIDGDADEIDHDYEAPVGGWEAFEKECDQDAQEVASYEDVSNDDYPAVIPQAPFFATQRAIDEANAQFQTFCEDHDSDDLDLYDDDEWEAMHPAMPVHL